MKPQSRVAGHDKATPQRTKRSVRSLRVSKRGSRKTQREGGSNVGRGRHCALRNGPSPLLQPWLGMTWAHTRCPSSLLTHQYHGAGCAHAALAHASTTATPPVRHTVRNIMVCTLSQSQCRHADRNQYGSANAHHAIAFTQQMPANQGSKQHGHLARRGHM